MYARALCGEAVRFNATRLPSPVFGVIPQVTVSLFCWVSGAFVCYFAIGALQRAAHLPIQAIGGGALLCNFAVRHAHRTP